MFIVEEDSGPLKSVDLSFYLRHSSANSTKENYVAQNSDEKKFH